MMPIVDGLEEEFAGEIAVVRLDVGVAENEKIQQGYSLRGHPTIAILNSEGDVVQRYFGEETAVILREALTSLLDVNNQ